MPKTFQIRDGLTPTKLENMHDFYRDWYNKKIDMKSILSEYIKEAEKEETMAKDRRHVKDMVPFDGTSDEAFKGLEITAFLQQFIHVTTTIGVSEPSQMIGGTQSFERLQ